MKWMQPTSAANTGNMIKRKGKELQPSETVKAYLADIVCHGAWGFSFMATRGGLNVANVFTLLSHRFLLSFLLMHVFPGQIKSIKLSRKQVVFLLLLGFAQPVLYFFGEEIGILHSTTSFSGVMIAMIPIVSIIAAAVFLKEKATLGQVLFCMISVCGVIGIGLLNGNSGSLDWIGVLALLLAVVSGSAYTLLSRSLSSTTSPFTRTYFMLAIGSVVFTIASAIKCNWNLDAYLRPLTNLRYDVSVVFLSVICSVLCFFLSGYAVTRLPVARETAFSNLTTAVSVFAGVMFLHESFSWMTFLFCLLILVGIWGVQHFAAVVKQKS